MSEAKSGFIPLFSHNKQPDNPVGLFVMAEEMYFQEGRMECSCP